MSRRFLASPTLLVLLGCAAAMRVGMIMYAPLDPDEGEHLNAAWLVGQGHVPYRDYWDHHAPLFFYLMAPLLRLLADQPAIYPVGRLLMVVATTVGMVLVHRLGRHVSEPVGRAAVVLLAFEPRFVTKTTEIRPDVAALVVWLAALLMLIGWRKEGRARWLWFSGLAVGLAVTLSLKTVFGIPAVALLVVLAAGEDHHGGLGVRWSACGRLLCGLCVAPAMLVGWLRLTGGPAAVEAAVEQLVFSNARAADFGKAGPEAEVGYGFMVLGLVGLGVTLWRQRGRIVADPVHGPLAVPILTIAAILLLPTTPGVAGHAWLPVVAGLGIYAGLAWTAVLDGRWASEPLRRTLATLIPLACLILPAAHLTQVVLHRTSASQLRTVRRLLEETCPGEAVLDGAPLVVFRPAAYRYRAMTLGVLAWVGNGTILRTALLDEIRTAEPRAVHPDVRFRAVPEIAAFIATHYVPESDGVWRLGTTIPISDASLDGGTRIKIWIPDLYQLRMSEGLTATLDRVPVQSGLVRVGSGWHDVAWRGGPGTIVLTAATCPDREQAIGSPVKPVHPTVRGTAA